MKINPFIFRNYDIRGEAGKDFNTEIMEAIGKSYGTFLHRRKIRQAVVGRDCRLSGEEYLPVFIKGLALTGVDIINLGIIMTQMMYYGQYRFQTNGGAIMTASHNPWNFNGFKLGVGYSQTTLEDDVAEIKKYIDNDEYFIAAESGRVTTANIKEDYCRDVLKRIRLKKKFKIILDSRNGTTAIYAKDIFERAGLEVIGKNMEMDGVFPNGTPDPTDEKFMLSLGEDVKKEKADLGFAFDGDGDRLGVVDEKGQILWNDVLVAIFAKEILERFPGSKIIYNTLCSQIVREVIKQNGGIPIIWRTGHSFIKDKIATEGAAFGGELSGHFFFADNAYGHDDAIYAALRVLEYLSDRDTSLTKLFESFPKFISSPEIKIGCPDDKKMGVIKELSTKFKEDYKDAQITDDNIIPGDDGVRADFSDGMMVFRYSQNGPYITVKFEAKDQETYNERRRYVRETLKSYPEMIWEDQLAVNLDHLMRD